MPRYFADTHENGVPLRDDEGAELRGADDARRVALDTMADMARARILNGDRGHFRIDIRDAARRVIYSIALSLDGGWVDASAEETSSAKTVIAREFLLGIVQSCTARGEDVVSRLEQFRALQQTVAALASGDANASDISRQIVTEIDKLLEGEWSRSEAPQAAPQPDDR